MFKKTTWSVGILCCIALVTLSKSAPDFSKLRFNVVAEQDDALLHFKEGTITSLGGSGNDFNGFVGTSTDMGGGLLRTVIVLDHNVPDDEAANLASFQGRIEGEVKCKRIRRGDSPDAPGSEDPHSPGGRLHVLAESCAIVSLNHRIREQRTA